MSLTILWLFLLGFGTGIVGGFLGIGGGVIITAVLLEWFKAQGIPVETRFHLAFGTTLLAIIGTAVSSSLTYARMKRVVWPAVAYMSIAAVATSLIGSALSAASAGSTLKIAFVAFCVINAVLLLRKKPTAHSDSVPINIWKLLAIGALAGIVSAYLGVAGGIVMVPLLILWAGIHSDLTPGTTNSVGVLTSLVGAIGYAWQGSKAAELPDGSWGFVMPAIAVPILLGTLSGGPFGSLLNKRFGRRSFHYIFAIFILLVAARIYFKN